jgi:hypothetical protein
MGCRASMAATLANAIERIERPPSGHLGTATSVVQRGISGLGGPRLTWRNDEANISGEMMRPCRLRRR